MSTQSYPDGGMQLYFGIYPAIVTNVVPDDLGRIEVTFPWLGTTRPEGEEPDTGSLDGEDARVHARATLISPYADSDQGMQMIPEKDSQVLVAFEAGSLRRPYVLGSCWNGKEVMPDTSVQSSNDKRLIKTRSGSTLEFDDSAGAAKITLKTRAGHRLDLDEGNNEVVIGHPGKATIVLKSDGSIEISADNQLKIKVPVVNVDTITANFTGIINCTTLSASTSVVSPLFSQGGNNVW